MTTSSLKTLGTCSRYLVLFIRPVLHTGCSIQNATCFMSCLHFVLVHWISHNVSYIKVGCVEVWRSGWPVFWTTMIYPLTRF